MKLSKTLAIAFIFICCVSVFGQKNAEQLETGTYIANAYFDGLTKGGISYPTTTENVRIKILSLDDKNNIKAEVKFGDRGSHAIGEVKGKLSGKIDSSGILRLEGDLVSGNIIYETKLKATIKNNNTLVNGKIIMESTAMDWKGDFSKAIIVEEEEW